MKRNIIGSETFGTQNIRTDEYILLAKTCVENGSTIAQAKAEIEFIDDCLSMRKIMNTYGRSKNAIYTEAGRLRKNSNYMDFISKRLDDLICELKETEK